MVSCVYDFDQNRVEKVFGITEKGESKIFPPDISYVQSWDDFARTMDTRGYGVQISNDGYWVIIGNKE